MEYRSMTERIRVVVDLDSVAADLCTKWFSLYNYEYGDSLTMEHIASWDTHLYVKPECAMHIYDYLDLPGFYRDLDPMNGCRETLTWAANYFDLAICTN